MPRTARSSSIRAAVCADDTSERLSPRQHAQRISAQSAPPRREPTALSSFFPSFSSGEPGRERAGACEICFMAASWLGVGAKNLPLYFERQQLRADKVPNQQVSTPPTSA